MGTSTLGGWVRYAQGNHWAAASARALWATNRRFTSSMAARSGNSSRVTSWSSWSALTGCQ